MKSSISTKLEVSICIFICFAVLVPDGKLEAADLSAMKKLFPDPPRQYCSFSPAVGVERHAH
jgi:hypothetical protein